MKINYQKGFSIAAFFVAIAAFLGIGAHVATNIQATSTVDAMNQAQATSTSNWRTYTDTQHGFSIKYPENYGFATELSDGVEFGQDGNAYMTIHFPKGTFTGSNLSFADYMKQYDVKGYTHAQVNVDGINAQAITSSQIGTMVFVPLSDGLVLEVDGDIRNPSFTEALSTLKLSSQSSSSNSSNPNMSGGLNSSVQSNQSTSVQAPSISISPTSGPIGTNISVTLSGNIPAGAVVDLNGASGSAGISEVTGKQFKITVPSQLQVSPSCGTPPCIADPLSIKISPGTYKLSILSVDRSTGNSNEITSAQFTVTN